MDNGAVCLPGFFDQNAYDRLLNYSKSLTEENRYRITFREGTPYEPLDPGHQAVSLPRKDSSYCYTTPFHFDDSYVNAVFAMIMPTDHREGYLLLYRNLRNRAKPLLVSRIAARLLRHSDPLRALIRPKGVVYQERTLHVFFGDLSLHGAPNISGGERLTFTLNAHRGHVPA